MANAKACKACHARQFHLTSSCGLGTAYAHSIGGQDALELHSTAYLARELWYSLVSEFFNALI